MMSYFLGLMLICFLLAANSFRIFFLKYGRIDSLTILAPIALMVSLLHIAAWSLDFYSLFFAVLSVFSTIINFRALLRFVSGLYVDHYRLPFKIGAFFVLSLSLFAAGVLIYFRPSFFSEENYDSIVSEISIQGNFHHGIEIAEYFKPISGTIYKIENKKLVNRKLPILIFEADKRADVKNYMPYLLNLSKNGFTVYTGDFYTKDSIWFSDFRNSKYFRRFSMILAYLKNEKVFSSQKEFFSFNSAKEIEALMQFALYDLEQIYYDKENLKYNSDSEAGFTKFFIITDWMGDIAGEDFVKEHKDFAAGHYSIASCEDYIFKGWGCIEKTNPLQVRLWFGKSFNPKDMEEKMTEKTIEAVLKMQNLSTFF